MTVTLISPLTKEKILNHVDDLICSIKEFNAKKHDIEVVQAVLYGHVINSKIDKNYLFLRFKNTQTNEIFPPIINLEDVKDSDEFINNENILFDKYNFLDSNYVQIKSIAQLDVLEGHQKGVSKIVFDTEMKSLPPLKNSLNVTKDYYLYRKLSQHIVDMKKRTSKPN